MSLADLLSHPELDPDSDGLFTEAEAQVNATVFLKPCMWSSAHQNPDGVLLYRGCWEARIAWTHLASSRFGTTLKTNIHHW